MFVQAYTKVSISSWFPHVQHATAVSVQLNRTKRDKNNWIGFTRIRLREEGHRCSPLINRNDDLMWQKN